MMKKTLSFILILCMALSMMPAHAEETAAVHVSYEILNKTGLINKSAEEKVTREEFAQLLFDIMHFADEETEDNSWEDNFWGDLAEEAELTKEAGTSYTGFTDVDPYSEYTAAIQELVNIGVMQGVSDNEFKPEQNVKNVEIIKSILNMMGYKTLCNIQGGYYDGYLACASQLGISREVSTDALAEATAADTARILYNAFDVKLMEFRIGKNGKELVASETKTFLTGIMNMDYIRGIITDNGVTSLYGASDAGKNNIICGNVTLQNTGINAAYIQGLLGYNADVYYFVDGDKEGQAVFAVPTRKNRIITFDIADFEEYENGTISYEEENNIKRVKIPDNAHFIYNDVAITSIPKDIFEFDNGYVTLIAPENSGIETVIIKSYISMYVGSFDTKSNIIYNKTYSQNDTASFSVNEAYENETLTVKDTSGKPLALTDITSGSVIDISQNGMTIEIIVSNERVDKFKLIGKTREDEEIILKGAEAEYILDNAFSNAQNALSYNIGDTLTLYLNSFGKIVWMEKGDSYTLNVGYFLKIVHSDETTDGSDEYFVKLINVDGSGVRYRLADKVKYGDENTVDQGAYKKLKPENVYNRMNTLSPGIIGYGLNDDKEIDMIELPLKKRDGENRLQLINSGVDMTYKNDAGGKFLDKIWTDTNTIVFTTPPSPEDMFDETKYNCLNKSSLFSSDGTYTVTGYTTEAGGIRAKYMTMEIAARKTLDFDENTHQFFIVTDVTEGLDADEDTATIISGYKTSAWKGSNNGLTFMTLYAKDGAGVNANGDSVNPATAATATMDMTNTNPKYYTVKKGDIIRYRYESDETLPTGIEILFRADMEGDFGGAKGAIPGVKEYADEKGTPYNVFAFSDYKGILTTAVEEYLVSKRVEYGSLYSIDSDVGTLTNRDLTVSGYDSALGRTSYVPIKTSSTTVTITYDKKNISAAMATKSDYKPYTDYGAGCSKILTVTSNGWTTFTFVINGEFNK